MDLQSMTNEQLTEALGLAYLEQANAKKKFEELKDLWKKRVGNSVGDVCASGAVEVYLSPNNRWDEETARKVLTEALSPEAVKGLEVTVIDSKRAKKELPPAWYEKCQKPGEPKMQVRFS